MRVLVKWWKEKKSLRIKKNRLLRLRSGVFRNWVELKIYKSIANPSALIHW
jgi:hypothetical protein